jgi:hypothetical protein
VSDNKKRELQAPFFYYPIFLFLREFYIRIKSADDGYPKIRQHKLLGGLIMPYR